MPEEFTRKTGFEKRINLPFRKFLPEKLEEFVKNGSKIANLGSLVANHYTIYLLQQNREQEFAKFKSYNGCSTLFCQFFRVLAPSTREIEFDEDLEYIKNIFYSVGFKPLDRSKSDGQIVNYIAKRYHTNLKNSWIMNFLSIQNKFIKCYLLSHNIPTKKEYFKYIRAKVNNWKIQNEKKFIEENLDVFEVLQECIILQRRWLNVLNDHESTISGEFWINKHIPQVLRYYYEILKYIEQYNKQKMEEKKEFELIKVFSLVPLYDAKRHFIDIDNKCFRDIMRSLKHILRGYGITDHKTVQWSDVFNYENLWTHAKEQQRFRFGNHIQTDGVSICFLFKKKEEENKEEEDKKKQSEENKKEKEEKDEEEKDKKKRKRKSGEEQKREEKSRKKRKVIVEENETKEKEIKQVESKEEKQEKEEKEEEKKENTENKRKRKRIANKKNSTKKQNQTSNNNTDKGSSSISSLSFPSPPLSFCFCSSSSSSGCSLTSHIKFPLRIIAIDPGRENIIYGVERIYTEDCIETEEIIRVYRLTRKEYYSRGGINAARNKAAKWIKDDGMVPHNTLLSLHSAKTAYEHNLIEHLQHYAASYNAIWDHKLKKRNSKLRLRTYLRKNQCLDRFFNSMCYDKATKTKLSKPIVAFGSAKFAPTGPGELAVPTTAFYQRCCRYYTTELVSEFRSTKICNSCFNPLNNIYVPSKEIREAEKERKKQEKNEEEKKQKEKEEREKEKNNNRKKVKKKKRKPKRFDTTIENNSIITIEEEEEEEEEMKVEEKFSQLSKESQRDWSLSRSLKWCRSTSNEFKLVDRDKNAALNILLRYEVENKLNNKKELPEIFNRSSYPKVQTPTQFIRVQQNPLLGCSIDSA